VSADNNSDRRFRAPTAPSPASSRGSASTWPVRAPPTALCPTSGPATASPTSNGPSN